MRKLLFLAAAVLLSIAPALGQSSVRVDESKIQAVLENDSTVVIIPFSSSADHEIKGQLSLAWLGIDEKELNTVHQEIVIRPGQNEVRAPLRLFNSSIWNRLRYSLGPSSGAASFAPISGIVSLSRIADYCFELALSSAGAPSGTERFSVFGQAVHPITGIPISGISWKTRMVVDDKEISPVSIKMHEDAFVEFVFDAPALEGIREPMKSITVEAVGRRGDFEQESSINLWLNQWFSAKFQSDKPIYQPGQTMHMRAVILDANGKAAPNEKIILRIEDQNNERVHYSQMVSSKFGIVQDEWTISSSAAIGDYSIKLTREGSDNYGIAYHHVRISRYELPSFRVDAKADQRAYLLGEQPRVTVSGTYLFGKPVPKGKVKIVRVYDPEWNFEKHKYESPVNKVVAEGDAANDGTFTALLDVTKDQEDLKPKKDDDREYSERFRDIHFAAYYKDADSGRTEQRRFDIRITREPIHVYVLQNFNGGSLPYPIYISTSYADGAPASATVELKLPGSVVRLKTNRYGIGKTMVANILPDDSREAKIEVVAKDAAGKTGTYKDALYARGERYRVDSNHTVYRIGEAVTLRIIAPPESPADQILLIHALSNNRRIASRVIRLKNHQAEATFPYQSEFRREIDFGIWNASESDEHYTGFGSKTVIFPNRADLIVAAQPDRESYKPGEMAALEMKTMSIDGKPVEAVLGLAIVDQAVQERARTDNDFGQGPWFRCAFCLDDYPAIGGMSLEDFFALKPESELSPDLDLVAEALVSRGGAFISPSSNESITDAPHFEIIASQIKQLQIDLQASFFETGEYPLSTSSLSRSLGDKWARLRDPWGMPYTASFEWFQERNDLIIRSGGPDKVIGTNDDFNAGRIPLLHFGKIERIVRLALKDQEDYPATRAELFELLRKAGFPLETLRDEWGTPYQTTVKTVGAQRRISIVSAGPDKIFGTKDDLNVANIAGLYFQKNEKKVDLTLNNADKKPQTVNEFKEMLERAGIDIAGIHDAWGRPYRISGQVQSDYTDKTVLSSLRTNIVPIVQTNYVFTISSIGPDGIVNTADDFTVASFPVLLSESPAPDGEGSSGQPAAIPAGYGLVTGSVKDQSSAVMPGVSITLESGAASDNTMSALSNNRGIFIFGLVPIGNYHITASLQGFVTEDADIVVEDRKTTKIDFSMMVSGTLETVTVTSNRIQTATVAIRKGALASTPRVREYFPETLFWAPEIITDADGQAHVEVPLADAITTWKVAAIASTLDGQIAETESDFRTFQPFFLDFNPPPVLTEGDRIALPVTVRNYQDKAHQATVKIIPNDWSTIQGNAAQSKTIPANSSVNASYVIQAKKATEKAVQRIIADAGNNSDAIEKSLRVHPDGQEIAQTYADLISGQASFNLDIPRNAIAGAARGEIRVYPNIASLLLESASALLQKPYGCAEQIISAGYANLIALRYAKAMGMQDEQLEKHAIGNIKMAVSRIDALRSDKGGISYWKNSNPDIAVTAYALNFLVEASSIASIDSRDMHRLAAWLEEHQEKNGTWIPSERGSPEQKERQTLLLTASVARALASAKKGEHWSTSRMVNRALRSISQSIAGFDEPYVLAQFILAALDSGNEALLGDAVKRLAALGHEEKGGLYWNLQTNSPFYGWGTAGRYETTGLAVSALSAWLGRHPESKEFESLIRRGLIFLLRARGGDGWWQSTQATLNAMRAIIDSSQALGGFGIQGGKIEVRLNGKAIKTIEIKNDSKLMDPVLMDISSSLVPVENQVELVPTSGMKTALVLVSSTHWLAWEQAKTRTSPELRLNVAFDRLNANVGDPIRCSVKAERIGFRGYGMMLAEIGLPPGAEVDRASLEPVIKDYALGVDQYEILPDRVVFYLWPKAGGSSFDFSFSPRLSMKAKSARSVLYDYYNPEALVEIRPFQWIVK